MTLFKLYFKALGFAWVGLAAGIMLIAIGDGWGYGPIPVPWVGWAIVLILGVVLPIKSREFVEWYREIYRPGLPPTAKEAAAAAAAERWRPTAPLPPPAQAPSPPTTVAVAKKPTPATTKAPVAAPAVDTDYEASMSSFAQALVAKAKTRSENPEQH